MNCTSLILSGQIFIANFKFMKMFMDTAWNSGCLFYCLWNPINFLKLFTIKLSFGPVGCNGSDGSSPIRFSLASFNDLMLEKWKDTNETSQKLNLNLAYLSCCFFFSSGSLISTLSRALRTLKQISHGIPTKLRIK